MPAVSFTVELEDRDYYKKVAVSSRHGTYTAKCESWGDALRLANAAMLGACLTDEYPELVKEVAGANA